MVHHLAAPAGVPEPHGGHHVPPAWIFHAVFVALIIGTIITVAASYVDLGRTANIVIALAIAVVKASLVCVFFMHLKWDKPFNSVILLVSLGFTALFLGLATVLDLVATYFFMGPAVRILASRQVGLADTPSRFGIPASVIDTGAAIEGYSLRLTFGEVEDGALPGTIEFAVPGEDTRVSGAFVAALR